MNLRKAEIGDKKVIKEIVNALNLGMSDFVWGQDDFLENQIEKGEYFIAQEGANSVGIVSFRQRGDKMYVETLVVVKEMRLKGIGSQIIEFAKDYTRQAGLNELCACSFCEYNTENFYLSLGFSLSKDIGEYCGRKFHRFEIKI
jgi:N-acetylglutamate synthase-like GNAT family acetyltransferase